MDFCKMKDFCEMDDFQKNVKRMGLICQRNRKKSLWIIMNF